MSNDSDESSDANSDISLEQTAQYMYVEDQQFQQFKRARQFLHVNKNEQSQRRSESMKEQINRPDNKLDVNVSQEIKDYLCSLEIKKKRLEARYLFGFRYGES